MLQRIFISGTLFMLSIIGIGMCMIQRSCGPTWFRPVEVQVTPLALPPGSCVPDTTGIVYPGQAFGFALHFCNSYTAAAAVEPGILGIADTLTGFSILAPGAYGDWQDVSGDFYYGLPGGCSEIGNSDTFDHFRGRFSCAWMYQTPGRAEKQSKIDAFVRFFNQIGKHKTTARPYPTTGLQVEHADFTFWATPAFLVRHPEPVLKIVISTASGKHWSNMLRFTRATWNNAAEKPERTQN
jgi:hypothetical protein